MRLEQDFIEQVKWANPIEQVICETVPLKREGKILAGAHHTHPSKSGTSLKVDPEKGLYHCFNCGEGGDVFTWVMNTRGYSFWEAVSYLARRAGIPLPKSSPEDTVKREALWQEQRELEKVFLEAAKFYHSQLTLQLRDWAYQKWGLKSETLDRFLVGFAPASGTSLKEHLKAKGFSPDLLIKSGLFIKARDSWMDFFRGRLVFPYWTHLPMDGANNGTVVYFIGRQTEFTPEDPWEAGKYKKQLTHSEEHPFVSETVDNRYFYGEHAVRAARGNSLFITEGVADCLAALQAGLPCISPCTTRFSEASQQRLLRLCNAVEAVYIVNDNEESRAGEKGALATAEFLENNGVRAYLISLPRPEGTDKIDLAEYLRDHSVDEFRSLLEQRKTYWEIRLKQWLSSPGSNDCVKALEFAQKVLYPCGDELRVVTFINNQVKQAFSLKATEAQAIAKEYRKARKVIEREQRIRAAQEERNKSVEALKDKPIKQKLVEYEIECQNIKKRPEYAEKARICYNWIVENGGMFFATETAEVWLWYKGFFYEVEDCRPFNALMFQLAELVPTTSEGRAIWEGIQSLAYTHGKKVTVGGWLYTDRKQQAIYVNLQKGKLARISPDDVTVIPNAINDEGILLTDDFAISPIDYISEADVAESVRLLKQMVVDNLACDPCARWFVTVWGLTAFLSGFAGETLPLHRNSGSSSAGKTWGARILSYLIYGQDMVGKGTDAANFSEGVRVPIIFEDNLEGRNMTVEKRDFLLMVATGARKRKRDIKSPTGVVHEKPQALVMTTGIEPFFDQEILNRTYETVFDRFTYQRPDFVEVDVIDSITENRNYILSGLFKLLAHHVLPGIKMKQRKWKKWLSAHHAGWPKDRTNDYLATMMVLFEAMFPYIDRIEAPWEEDNSVQKSECETIFHSWVESQTEVYEESGKDTSEAVWFFEGLYKEWLRFRNNREELEQSEYERVAGDERAYVEVNNSFEALYRLKATEKDGIFSFEACPYDLFVAYTLLCKNFNKKAEFKTSRQMGQRIGNDKSLLRKKGWTISSEPSKTLHGTRYYLYSKAVSYEPEEALEKETDIEVAAYEPF